MLYSRPQRLVPSRMRQGQGEASSRRKHESCRSAVLVRAIALSKTTAIVQSNYIPWRGYFDLINSADEFILYDDMQYTRRDWRNRNIIKSARGPIWLTIPVQVKGKYLQTIKHTEVADENWARDHWNAIVHNYSRASCFSDYRDLFEDLYLGSREKFLSQINYRFISGICRILGIKTNISFSMNYDLMGSKTERLVNLCKQTGATNYLTGPAARTYLDEELFAREGISVSYIDYDGYPEYGQLYPPFEPRVSIIDLVFNQGPGATKYMKSF